MRKFSVIIHVEKAGSEISFLLNSLRKQTYRNFEVIIIQDCHGEHCEIVYNNYRKDLKILFFDKPEAGEGYSLNFGIIKSSGNFLLVIDPDSYLPGDYLEILNQHLDQSHADAFKGSFYPGKPGTFMQARKVADLAFYSLSGKRKFFTTYSNSGFTREVFDKTGGYLITGSGGNEELFNRIEKMGYRVICPEDLLMVKVGVSLWENLFDDFFRLGNTIVKFSYYQNSPFSLSNFLPLILFICFIVVLVLAIAGISGAYLVALFFAAAGLISAIYWGVKKHSLITGFMAAFLLMAEIIIYSLGTLVAAIRSASR
jgi:glycosyltransferase involved in cell wall biosynthesis